MGALSFELVGGNLRDIRFGGVEVLEAIQYLVRDRDWGTLEPDISGLVVEQDDALHIRYRAECDGLSYDATIVASGTTLDFAVEAQADCDFETNRLGFCVLHGAHLAGAPLSVEHGDGSVEQASFPWLIDPRQPFTDIHALTHRQADLTVECRLEGDVFEMEDQRNWSDASYKTYVRPLARPWPYTVPAGSRDSQRVSLRVTGKPSAPAIITGAIDVTIGDPIGVMPRVGLVATPNADTLGVQDLLVGVDALTCVLPGTSQRLTLECVIVADGDLDEELSEIAGIVAKSGLSFNAIAVFPAPDLQSTPPGSAWPPCPPLADVYAAARRAFPDLALGGGMFSYFTELNRKRVPADNLDFITHATCPIVHAADDRSVMASLRAVPHILRSARAIYPAIPYRLGPISIGMRQNPYGSRTMSNPDRGRIPMAAHDPRQDGQFAAAWTIGYAAMTEEAGLDTLTFGPTSAEAVRLLASLAGQPRRACIVDRPNEVAAIHAGDTLVLANLTAEPLTVGKIEFGPFEIGAY